MRFKLRIKEYDLAIARSNSNEDGNGPRFHAAQSEMVISQANLNRISQGSCPDYSYGSTGHDAHFHQAASDCARSLDADNSRCQTRGQRIERSCSVHLTVRLSLIFPQCIFSSSGEIECYFQFLFQIKSNRCATTSPKLHQFSYRVCPPIPNVRAILNFSEDLEVDRAHRPRFVSASG